MSIKLHNNAITFRRVILSNSLKPFCLFIQSYYFCYVVHLYSRFLNYFTVMILCFNKSISKYSSQPFQFYLLSPIDQQGDLLYLNTDKIFKYKFLLNPNVYQHDNMLKGFLYFGGIWWYSRARVKFLDFSNCVRQLSSVIDGILIFSPVSVFWNQIQG